MRLNKALTLLATTSLVTAAATGSNSRLESKSRGQYSGLLSLLCDTRLKTLVGACYYHDHQNNNSNNNHGPAKDNFHAHLVSKYADHMLLRFNISTASEQDAFYSAVDTLLLDVWSVTRDHTDVRVRAGDVKALLGMLPTSLHDAHTVLSHDLSGHVSGTYPDTFKQQFQTQAAAYSDVHVNQLAASDDLFFRDYQPLPVCCPPPSHSLSFPLLPSPSFPSSLLYTTPVPHACY